MRKFKVIIHSILIIFLATTLIVIPKTDKVQYQDYNITIDYDANSEFLYMVNRDNDKVKYKKNENEKAYPASLTKIMTTIIALEEIDDLDKKVAIDQESYYSMISKNAALAGFHPLEQVSYLDLIHGTMLSSGGEAASSLAVNVAGSTKAFVELMNKKSLDLNLLNTNFTNPEGLHDDDQYTTAKDIFKLFDYALDNQEFKNVISKITYTTSKTIYHPNGIDLESTVLSKLVDLDEDFVIVGGKSGYTPQAGRNWATLGIKNGLNYVSIVMGAYPDDNKYDTDKHILDTLEVFKRVIQW